MAFSGALTLTDLNDFITPSQACIKPVEQSTAIPEKEPGAASTEIRIDSTGVYYEVAETKTADSGSKLEQAQISLVDCLACSGCITSAESILITLQSHTEVLTFLESNKTLPIPKVPVISIAPQTLASLSASVSTKLSAAITPRQILRRLQEFCTKILGFEHVFDTTFARHLALKEHVLEFQERREAAREALSERSGVGGQQNLPMLASACPGWICYAEKAHPEMLPFIAQTKSPQQVMGTLVKNWLGNQWDRLPDAIYHVAVMPCYDKKLEASRRDFYNDAYSTRDVDCVITTGELELLMNTAGFNLSDPVAGELDLDFPEQKTTRFPELVSHPGTSSGSYLHAIIADVVRSSTVPLTLSVKTIRNTDYEEYILRQEDDEKKVVFRGAKCYGFRNLQNVVRRVGRDRGMRIGAGAAGKLASARVGGGIKARIASRKATGVAEKLPVEEQSKGYDYVEVMACPGGCVNGGGQLKPPVQFSSNSVDAEGYKRDWESSGVLDNAKWGDKEWTKKVEEVYWSTSPTPATISNEQSIDDLARAVVDDLCHDDKDTRRKFFRTQYRAVESEVIGLAVKW